MRLYVIRHAQSTMNASQQGGPNCDLSELGRWQAEQIVHYFRDFPVDKIYCSPLQRVIKTAAPLAAAKNMTIHLVPEMAEIFNKEWTDYRDYAWESSEEIMSSFPQTQFIETYDPRQQWWPKWPEDPTIVRRRVQKFYDALIAPNTGKDTRIVVFGHGQTTADLKQIANPGDTFPVYHAAVVEFILNAEGKCESAQVHTEHLGPHVFD